MVFVLATTDPRKIPATVLSRCQRFDFRPIPPEQLTATLTEILTKEGVRFEPGALPLLVRAAEGSLRDALSLLDTAIAYGGGALDEASVARLLGSSVARPRARLPRRRSWRATAPARSRPSTAPRATVRISPGSAARWWKRRAARSSSRSRRRRPSPI